MSVHYYLLDIFSLTNFSILNFILGAIVSSLSYLIAKYGDRFVIAYRIQLESHAVFNELAEARLKIEQIAYKNEFRKVTILLWHKIVLDYQEQFCKDVLQLKHMNRRTFAYACGLLAQTQLTKFTKEIMATFPETIERKYSSLAYVAREQLRESIFFYATHPKLLTVEKIDGIFRNVSFYCKFVFSIANLQNEINGELKTIPYTFIDIEGKEKTLLDG